MDETEQELFKALLATEAGKAKLQQLAKSLADQLSAEREAGVERARAAGSMTINTSSK